MSTFNNFTRKRKTSFGWLPNPKPEQSAILFCTWRSKIPLQYVIDRSYSSRNMAFDYQEASSQLIWKNMDQLQFQSLPAWKVRLFCDSYHYAKVLIPVLHNCCGDAAVTPGLLSFHGCLYSHGRTHRCPQAALREDSVAFFSPPSSWGCHLSIPLVKSPWWYQPFKAWEVRFKYSTSTTLRNVYEYQSIPTIHG